MMRWTGRGIFIYILLIYTYAQSQDYPEWFLHPEKIKCKPTVVGYSYPFHYEDSFAVQAFNNGCVNYARQLFTEFSGGQAFLPTEIGTFWMGSDFIESFDTTAISIGISQFQILDTFVSKNIVTVLLGLENCELSNKNKKLVSIKQLKTPCWVETIPKDNQYDYAVGMAPNYYHEASSWMEAEKVARKHLACNRYVIIKSLQKMGHQIKEIQYEEIFISLRNIEIVGRWRDLQSEIFYVLIRVLKTNYDF